MSKAKSKVMPLTKEQQKLIEDYLSKYEQQMYKCIHNTAKHRELNDEDIEELRGVAYLGLCKAAGSFNPNKKMAFASFAYLNMASMVKNVWRKEHRAKVIPKKQISSLEQITPCGLALKEVLSDDKEIDIQECDRVERYLQTLSNDAKVVLSLILADCKLSDLQKRTGFDTRYIRQLLIQLQDYRRVEILRRNNYAGGERNGK